MAKFWIVYSSKTGNTKKIAEALKDAAPKGSVLTPVEEVAEPEACDVVFVGFWVDKGGPDAKAAAFLRTLKQKKVVLFETMGADPQGEHAMTSLANAAICLSEGNRVLGALSIQGAIDPHFIAAMDKRGGGNPHDTKVMGKIIGEAAKHPNEVDLENARIYMENFYVFYKTYFEHH